MKPSLKYGTSGMLIENAYYELKYRIDNNIKSPNKYSPYFDPCVFKDECSVSFEEFEKFIGQDDLIFPCINIIS